MPRETLSIVKVGGSLLKDRIRLHAELRALANGAEGPCVIVPGGGPFADAVRRTQADLGFGDILAHRLAIDAMACTAKILCAVEERLVRTRYLVDLHDVVRSGRTAVWDPAPLKDVRTIPEDWTFTADAAALWLAGMMNADRCVILKSTAVPTDATYVHLAELGVVDMAFPGYAARYGGEIMLRGAGTCMGPTPENGASSCRSPASGGGASLPSDVSG